MIGINKMKLVKESLTESDELIEKLADLEHDRWSRWQQYLHSQCTKNKDGSLTIPKEKVDRWERQIATPYSELSEKEKDSDREEAMKTMELLDITESGVTGMHL